MDGGSLPREMKKTWVGTCVLLFNSACNCWHHIWQRQMDESLSSSTHLKLLVRIFHRSCCKMVCRFQTHMIFRISISLLLAEKLLTRKIRIGASAGIKCSFCQCNRSVVKRSCNITTCNYYPRT